MQKKYTPEQKEAIASWIKEQLTDADIDRKSFLAGIDAEGINLDNYLNGKTYPKDEIIDSMIEHLDSLKVVSTYIGYNDRFHHLDNTMFSKLANRLYNDNTELFSQDEFSKYLDISQKDLSNILNGRKTISPKLQERILDYFYRLHDKTSSIDYNLLCDRIEETVAKSCLYELIDMVLRHYRYLPVKEQNLLETIMYNYLLVYAYNMKSLEELKSCFLYPPKDAHSTFISDTIRFYNKEDNYEKVWSHNNELKEYCRQIRKDIMDGKTEEAIDYELLICALSASAKDSSHLSIYHKYNAAKIIGLGKLLKVTKPSADFYDALDELESRLPVRIKSVKQMREEAFDPADYDAIFGLYDYNKIAVSRSQIEDENKLREMFDSFSDKELEEFSEMNRDTEEFAAEAIKGFAELKSGEKQIIIDNLPCFLGFGSVFEFQWLKETFEQYKSLDDHKLKELITILSSYPSYIPSLGRISEYSINLTDNNIRNINDAYTEISYCRNMINICGCTDYESKRNKKRTTTTDTDKKNTKIFERVIKEYCEGNSGLEFECTDMLRCKLDFDAYDWYLWQLILNVYYTCGYKELDSVFDKVQNNTEN